MLCHRSARQLQPADKHKDGTVVEERVAVANVANSAAETKRSSVTTSLSDLLSLPHRCFKQVFVVVVFPHQQAHTHAGLQLSNEIQFFPLMLFQRWQHRLLSPAVQSPPRVYSQYVQTSLTSVISLQQTWLKMVGVPVEEPLDANTL